jgi:CheY-like chemotaxis protein
MGHKILLADDSITVQKIIKLTFSDEGVEVIAVGNGELAVQKLAEMRPDLVMADVFMPGKDGYEVCEYIKTHPELRQTPVILLVHAFEPFDQERALRVGADQHLTKPFQSIRALVATVKEMIAPPSSQVAYSAAASSSQPSAPAPEPISIPVDAESGFASFDAETVFAEADMGSASAPIETETSFPSIDAALALPTFAPVDAEPDFTPVETETAIPSLTSIDAETGFASVDTAPLGFAPHADQGSGEVLEYAMNAEPLQNEPESFVPQLTLEPLETELPECSTSPEDISLNVAGTEEPQSSDYASALNLNFDAESADALQVDLTADTEPLSCAAIIEEQSEVLDLDDELPPSPIQGEELDLLPEITSTPLGTTEITAAEPPACEPITNEPASEPVVCEPAPCEQFAETPMANGFPAAPDDALPILAEVEVPHIGSEYEMQATTTPECAELESDDTELMPLDSCQPAAESTEVLASAEADPLVPLKMPEPDAVLESAFTSENNALNGYGQESAIGEISQAQPASIEQSVKQDTSAGIETAPTDGFDLQAFPPALLDEIAKRVVERLSERAIQEIAWEVVPEMAELLIRKQLAEKVPR